MIRIFSKSRPEGVVKDNELMTPEVLASVETTGVYRGKCPCCDKRIVVRHAHMSASAGDEHYLLHGDGKP